MTKLSVQDYDYTVTVHASCRRVADEIMDAVERDHWGAVTYGPPFKSRAVVNARAAGWRDGMLEALQSIETCGDVDQRIADLYALVKDGTPIPDREGSS